MRHVAETTVLAPVCCRWSYPARTPGCSQPSQLTSGVCRLQQPCGQIIYYGTLRTVLGLCGCLGPRRPGLCDCSLSITAVQSTGLMLCLHLRSYAVASPIGARPAQAHAVGVPRCNAAALLRQRRRRVPAWSPVAGPAPADALHGPPLRRRLAVSQADRSVVCQQRLPAHGNLVHHSMGSVVCRLSGQRLSCCSTVAKQCAEAIGGDAHCIPSCISQPR